MAKSIFEEMGGRYVQVGDYLLPDLKLPKAENRPVGVWGQRHARYLKENHKIQYVNLLTSGKLNSYLADIDEQANELFAWLVEQMAQREGVTEKLKAEDMMAWVRKMNNIRSRAMEIVNADIIYT